MDAAGAVGQELTAGGLSRGCTVAVTGLQGAPQHNGKVGTVEAFLQDKGRYVVRLPITTPPASMEQQQLALKPENLIPA